MTHSVTPLLYNRPFLWHGTADHACLLLHGLGGGVYEMQLLGAYLHGLGLTVQGINYPGHDASALWMPNSSWHDWFDHIVTAYEQLEQTHQKVSVIGFSTGCPLGLHLAATFPIEHLVLLCPYVAIRYQWFHVLPAEALVFSLGYLINHVPRWRLPIRDPMMESAARDVAFFRSFNLTAVRSAIDLIEQVKQELTEIEVPTLILQAKQDTIVDPAGAVYIYQRLSSPQKRLLWLDESDHIIPLDLERELVFAEVADFLS